MKQINQPCYPAITWYTLIDRIGVSGPEQGKAILDL